MLETMDSEDLLIYGYLRLMETTHKFIIPHEIQVIISQYLMKYLIFGIGTNESGQFALGHKNKVQKWTELSSFEEIISSLDNIYMSFRNIMIISSNNQIYVAGENRKGSLGLNSSESITTFTKLDIKGIKPKFISSISDLHSFIVSIDNKLYANGTNTSGSLGNGLFDEDIHLFEQIPTDFVLNKNELVIDIKCLAIRNNIFK